VQPEHGAQEPAAAEQQQQGADHQEARGDGARRPAWN